MSDTRQFGELLLFSCGALLVAIGVRAIAGRLAIPTAALLLVVAAAASDIVEQFGTVLSFRDVQRITTVALVIILFEGGAKIGLERFRAAAVPIVTLGLVGTLATGVLIAMAAHLLLGLSWIAAALIGAALAPTDPAVTFSVLAGREVEGRSGTILEGESGFNDPVGIAVMIGVIDYATHHATVGGVAGDVLREMGVGLVVGIVGGALLGRVLRRVRLPDRTLYPLAVMLSAGFVFGVGTVLHGSGFLAVFVAGIVVGDVRYAEERAVRSFNGALGDLGELAAFVALGLTVDLTAIVNDGLWWRGLVLAALLGLVVRPLVVTPLLLPVRLDWGERGFVVWSGLKGAVPILLASLAVVGGTEYASELYGIVFVVVLVSVAFQGALVPHVAARLGVPMSRQSYE